MAQDGLFFKRVGELNRHGVPRNALVLQCVWGALLTLSGTYGELLAKMASSLDPEHEIRAATQVSNDEGALASILRRLGREQEANALEARRRQLWRSWQHRWPNNAFIKYLAEASQDK